MPRAPLLPRTQAARPLLLAWLALAACNTPKTTGSGGDAASAGNGLGAGNGNGNASGAAGPNGASAGQPGVAVGGGNSVAAQPAGNDQVGPVGEGNRVVAIGTLGGPDNAFVLVGRFDTTVPNAPRFSLPNSRIGATFSGTSLGLLLACDANDALAVQVDGNAPSVVYLHPNGQPSVYPVASALAAGNHTVWLTKRTESYEVDQRNANVRTGTITFSGLVLDTGAAVGPPPAPRGHLFVALGDSSFTGYGVDQLQTGGISCVFSPNTQNALLSVPGQLADLLGAEVINVSASGKGIAQSAYDLNNLTDQLPALWRKTVPPASAPAYAFPALDVDAVLVSAGSDDLVGAYGVGVISSPAAFVATYTALLSDIRSHYPRALLVGLVNPNAIGSDKTTLTSLLTQAVASRNAAGDANVFVFDYFAGDANGWASYNDADAALKLGHGCQGHASPAGSLFLAQRLAAFLRAHAGA